MEFKKWLEGLYQLGSSGEVGGWGMSGPNDEVFAKKGVRSKIQSTDLPIKNIQLNQTNKPLKITKRIQPL